MLLADFRKSLSLQANVVYALMLREIHVTNGGTTLGYLWVMIQNGITMLIFWVMRTIMGRSPPHGISMFVFLLTGFGLFFFIRQCMKKCMGAVDSGKALLIYPQVTPLDLLLACTLLSWLTQFVICMIFLAAALCLGEEIHISSVTGIYAVLLLSFLLAVGLGLMCSVLVVYFPGMQRLMSYLMLPLMFISGAFFTVDRFPHYIAEILVYNPILQLIEFFRGAMSHGYPVYAGCSWYYVTLFTLTTLAVGLLLERHVRPLRTVRQPQKKPEPRSRGRK